MLLQGKTAVVTGTSQGIGRAIVQTFLDQGAKVHCLSRRENDITKEFADLAKERNTSIEFHSINITDEDLTVHVLKKLQSRERIDILVNNAGITRDDLSFRMSTENWKLVIDTNLTAAFITSRELIFHMIKHRGGAIINISSIVGLYGNAGQANYCAAKAGLLGLTRSMALESANRGVRVNAVAPGFIQTDMTEKFDEDIIKRFIPANRVGLPQEVANTCLFLASDLASYVTGEVISVSGGLKSVSLPKG